MSDTPIKKQLISLIFLLFIYLSVPLGAAAQVTVDPGQTSVSFRFQPGVPPLNFPVRYAKLIWSLSPDNGTATLAGALTTDVDGWASATLNFGEAACGTYTFTMQMWDYNDSGEIVILHSVSGTVSGKPPCSTAPSSSSSGTTSSSSSGTTSWPMKLIRISGDDQQGLPGEPLANPFVVQVLDQDGEPFEGATVRFSALRGGGSLSENTPKTDVDGYARSTLTLGAALGTNKVQVNVEGISQVLVFSAEATTTPSVPTVVSIISGDNQTGLTGEALADPFVVEVRDGSNTPLADVTVTFTVLTGGGTLSATTGTTGANGQAESTLTLGSDPGTNTVEVSVAGISQTEIFNAEATPTTLSIISGENQKGSIGEPLANPFIVQVHDQYGQPMEGVIVTFAVTAGDGSLSTTAVTTDANGEAESTLTLGTAAGTYTVEVSAEGIIDIVTFSAVAELLEFNLSLSTGLNLIHLPLRVRAVDGMPTTIQSVSELYNKLGGAEFVNYLITHDSQTQTWHGYFGDADRGTNADRRLTDQTGILADMIAPVSIILGGDALGTAGSSTITLNQGLNLMGLPLKDSRITRVSDLFRLDGIGGNIPVIILSDGGGFQPVGRVGDPGDIEIAGGQSFIMTAQRAAMVDISGEVWTNVSGAAASPPVTRKGIEVGNSTSVLALKGLVVDQEVGLNQLNFRVTVKNLSTGRVVTGITRDEGRGYRLTVVDIETARAATIGDILEISAQSPQPFIRVQPVRYAVTAEDVKQSLIQLPELVVYKIPAKTELLRNYPNPFNPETWIPYRLGEDAFVTLTIYDGNGQVVRTLDVGHRIASAYENRSKAIYWDGRNEFGESVASGVYFYTLTADDFAATRKMLILK